MNPLGACIRPGPGLGNTATLFLQQQRAVPFAGEGSVCNQLSCPAPPSQAGIGVRARCLQQALLLLCMTFPAMLGGTSTRSSLVEWLHAALTSKGTESIPTALYFLTLPTHSWTESEQCVPSSTSNTSSLAFSLTKARNTLIKASASPCLASWLTRGASEVLSK